MGNQNTVKITAKECPLSKIFNKEFEYDIPAYQRPYSWSTDQTEILFEDLYTAFEVEDGPYFLGSIVLIKDDNNPLAEVIDGQQRLTTLTILISVIVPYLSGNAKANCIGYLIEEGNEIENIASKPRLHLREKDDEFFNKYIQHVKLDELLQLDPGSLSNESQKHIQENCRLLDNKIKTKFVNKNNIVDEDKLKKFCQFLVNSCYLVVVYTPNKDSAFKVFSTMNSRGLDLLPIDLIKSDVIGKIDSKDQDKYTNKWEDLEIQATRAGFNDVFTHTRMIYAKAKAQKSLLEEFKKNVLDKTKSKDLVDNILIPYVNAYCILVNNAYKASRNTDEVNQYLRWLNRIDNSDWMPSAIKFVAEHNDEPDYMLWFMKKLERLTAYLHITAKDLNRRIERYNRLLKEMEEKNSNSINDKLSSIELTDEEKKEFMDVLDGNIYNYTSARRKYIILRLSTFVSDQANSYTSDPKVFTIEHVLPQTVANGSCWDTWWEDEDERKNWVHKIANLVPLTRRMNSAAQNYDFDDKKEKYFKNKKTGTTTYSLTTQVCAFSEWKPEDVKKRQKTLLQTFKEKWELG